MSDAIGPAKELKDSAAVIAGGSSGVGLATAEEFVRQGCTKVVLLGRNEERGATALARLREINPSADLFFISADLGLVQDVERATSQALEKLGGIDILVNSIAASYVPQLLFKTDLNDIAGILTGQALPPMLMSRAVLPAMREQKSGVIINIASDAAKVPTPGESVIGGGMAAIVVFTRTLAIEAKRDGIRANVLTPSLIGNTPVYDRVMSDPFSAKLFNNAAKLASLGVAEPEDLAGLIVFLCGPGGAKLTGQAISLNGGISAA
jgi:Dehydrogenases with different specificities (related to short-chain alcohol dehydrogenases)